MYMTWAVFFSRSEKEINFAEWSVFPIRHLPLRCIPSWVIFVLLFLIFFLFCVWYFRAAVCVFDIWNLINFLTNTAVPNVAVGVAASLAYIYLVKYLHFHFNLLPLFRRFFFFFFCVFFSLVADAFKQTFNVAPAKM